MPISETDLVYRLTNSSGPGNANATTDPNASLGGFLSATDIDLTTVLNNLWDDVPASESVPGDTEYRCIAILNSNGTQTAYGALLWIQSETADGSNIAIGADTCAASTKGSTGAQFVAVTSEDTAPAGVSFSTASSSGTAVSLGDIAADFTKGVWLRRVTVAGTTGQLDGVTLRLKVGSTP